ncbi:MAG TPA: lysophospholipid acyltransferase family protein [Chthonomonadaceae bacterium]|nr:lysophospholipid acyltransferase family protein [Chthonomonadaceae bacterium]
MSEDSTSHPTREEAAAPLPLRKRLDRLAGRVALLLVGPVRAMPLPLARAVGRTLGLLVYYMFRKRRRVALKNLELIYGESAGRSERARMAKAVFQHFGEWGAEFVKIPQLSRADVDRLASVEGEENLQAALASGKGALLITGHFGNWEFMARWLTTHGYPLNVVARKANDPNADKLLVDTREGNGANVFSRGNSARAILQCLKKNEIVGLLPDQNAADVFVPFFGHPTGTVDGPAVLHLKTGAPLLFSWCVRTPEDRFQITFEPPVWVAPEKERAVGVARVMTIINARLETQIRRHPTQWLWLHDRWRASPDVFQQRDTPAHRQKGLDVAKRKEEDREPRDPARR